MKHWVLAVGAALVVGLAATLYWLHLAHQREQQRLDAQIVSEMESLLEKALRSLPEEDALIAHGGAFKAWRRERWSRWSRMDWRPSHLVISGRAEYEKADVGVVAEIWRGPRSVVASASPQADWLKKHPEQRVRVINRLITVSERFADEPAPKAAGNADSGLALADRSEGYAHIQIEARHPAVAED
jgi:hypothetical protein